MNPIVPRKLLSRLPACAVAALLAACGAGADMSVEAPSLALRAEDAVVISRHVAELPDTCAQAQSEGETMLAVDPADPRHLQAVWIAGAYNGTNTGIAAESFDGGRSWSATPIPGTGPCTGGTGDYVLDQWVSIGAAGHTYYYAYAGHDGDATHTPLAKHTLASSAAAGQRWLPATIVDDNLQGAAGIISRTSITADPVVAGRAWAAWTRLLNPATDGVLVARTDDGGTTWQAPVVAAEVPAGAAAAWQLLATPSGDLVLLYGEADTTATARELARPVTGQAPPIANRALISSDGGLTWSAPVTIVDLAEFVLPRGAVGPDGRLYFVWAERAGDAYALRFVISADGGRSWSSPLTTSEFDPGPLALLDVQPDIAIDAQGVIGISFYSGASGDGRVARWIAYSHDEGRGWDSMRLVAPFDYDTGSGGTSDGVFGAYQGLVPMNPGFGAVFIAGTGLADDPTDVVFVRVVPGKP